MSVVDILRQCETRLERDAGLLVNRELDASLLTEINTTLFIKTGILTSFKSRPSGYAAFAEERESLRILRETRMATTDDLSEWGDAERDAHCRHFAMVRFLVGRVLWRMREEASNATRPRSPQSPSLPFLLFPSGTEGTEGKDVEGKDVEGKDVEEDVPATVTIRIPCALWMFGSPAMPEPRHMQPHELQWGCRRLCAAEMSAMACA